MATRGAKPLPTNVKRIRGTLRPGRTNPREPQASPAKLSCPPQLQGQARREWHRTSTELAAMGLLASVDRAALALYCDAWGRWLEATEALQKYGLIIKSPNGYPMQSPYLAVANKAAEQVRLLLGEFGMSPASRTRVHAAPSADEDDEFTRKYVRGGLG